MERQQQARESRENEWKRRTDFLLNTILEHRDRCDEFWADESLAASVNPELRQLATAIRDHWSGGESVKLSRHGLTSWANDRRISKREQAVLEQAYHRVAWYSAKAEGWSAADWSWMLRELRQRAQKDRLAELVRTVDKSDKRSVAAVKTVATLFKNGQVSLDDAIAQVEQIVAGHPATNDNANVVCLADIEPQELKWLWQERLPQGKIVLLYGDPGLGKSMLTLDCVARVTTGRDWGDGSPCERGTAIIVTAEDDLADTIRPRLDAAGADVTRVYAIETVRAPDKGGQMIDRCFTLADIAHLEVEMQRREDLKLVVIDPVSAFLNGTDSHKDSDIRQLLTPLGKLAAKYGVTIMLVTHMSKGGKGGNKALYRAMGSIGIAGAARAAYLVCRDPNDDNRRLFLPTKANLSKHDRYGLAYRIVEGDGGPCLVWDANAVQMTADEALTSSEDNSDPQRAEAKALLADMLKSGPVGNDEIMDGAKANGISDKTMRRAKDELKISTFKTGFGRSGKWMWQLPIKESETAPADEELNF